MLLAFLPSTVEVEQTRVPEEYWAVGGGNIDFEEANI